MDPLRSKRVRAAVAAPALALALAALSACGAEANDVATTNAATAPAEAAQAAAPSEPTAAPPAPTEEVPTQEPAVEEAPTVAEQPTATTEPTVTEASAAPAPVVVEKLSADVAIANADINIDNLAVAPDGASVTDIEVLAVGDGSIQTLSDVVVGDRPVLLWFFSPH